MYHLPTTPISSRHSGQVEQKQLNKAPEPQHGSHVLPLHSGFSSTISYQLALSARICHLAYCTKKSLVLTCFFFSGHDTPWPLGPDTTRHGVMGWAACRVAVSAIVDAILQFGCIWRIPLLYAFVDVLPRKGQWDFLGRARALTWTLESMEDAFGAFACIFSQTHFCSPATHLQRLLWQL